MKKESENTARLDLLELKMQDVLEERGERALLKEAYIIRFKKNIEVKDLKKVEKLESMYSRGLMSSIAERRTLSDECQLFLSKSENARIRELVAERIDLCRKAVNILIKDPLPRVRRSLIKNPLLSREEKCELNEHSRF